MNAMIDIETLSKENNAVVLSIGLVIFEPHDSSQFFAEHVWELGLLPQVVKGRHICPGTVEWWRGQEIEPPEGRDPVAPALEELCKVFKAWPSIENVWFRGPQFDEVKLQSLGKDFGVEMPWSYKSVSCCRTLCRLAKRDRNGDGDKFTRHDALDDCRSQALDVQYAMGVIYGGGLNSRDA